MMDVIPSMAELAREDPEAFKVVDVLLRKWLEDSEMGRAVASEMGLPEDELVESICKLRDEGFLVFQVGGGVDDDNEDISFRVWLAIDGEPIED